MTEGPSAAANRSWQANGSSAPRGVGEGQAQEPTPEEKWEALKATVYRALRATQMSCRTPSPTARRRATGTTTATSTCWSSRPTAPPSTTRRSAISPTTRGAADALPATGRRHRRWASPRRRLRPRPTAGRGRAAVGPSRPALRLRMFVIEGGEHYGTVARTIDMHLSAEARVVDVVVATNEDIER